MAKIVTKNGVSVSTATPNIMAKTKSNVSGVSVGEIKGSMKPLVAVPVASAVTPMGAAPKAATLQPNYQSVNGKIIDINKKGDDILNIPKKTSALEDYVANTQKESEDLVQGDYYKQYEAAQKMVDQGIIQDNPYPKTYKEYLSRTKEQNQKDTDLLTQQNAFGEKADKQGLERAKTQSQSAISGVTASMAQGREGVVGSSKPLVAQGFKTTTNQIVGEAQDRVQQAEMARKQAQDNLVRAQNEGNEQMVTVYSGQLASAEERIRTSKVAQEQAEQDSTNRALSTIQALSSNSALIANLSDEDLASLQESLGGLPTGVLDAIKMMGKQANAAAEAQSQFEGTIKGFDTLGKIFDSGSKMTMDQVVGLGSSLGLSMEDTVGLYQSREATRNDKSLTEEEKQVKNATDLDDFKRRARGVVNTDLEKVDYINSLYASGASQSQIEEVKRVMGITTDAVYELDLQKKSLDNQATSILNKYLPAEKMQELTKGGLDITGKEFDNVIKEAQANGASETEVLNLQKLRIDAKLKENEYNDVTGSANIPDGDMKSIFYQKGPSDYGHPEGKRECGEGYNDITDGPNVGNSYASKMATVTKQDNPKVGNGLMLPLAYGKLVTNNAKEPGHIETVIENNPITGAIKTVSWNRDGHGGQTIQTYTISELNKKYGNNWGFNDSTLRPEYETKLSSQKSAAIQAKGKLPNVTDQEILEAYNKSGKIFTTEAEQKEAIKAARSGGYLPEKPAPPKTDAQRASTGFFKRMDEAEKVFSKLSPTIEKMDWIEFNKQQLLPNQFKSTEFQQQEQAERDFINAKLRKESGAAISPSEFESAAQQYFPQPGDKIENLEQKRKNRQTVIDGLRYEAGGGDDMEQSEGGLVIAAKAVFNQLMPQKKAAPDPLNIGLGGDPLELGLS